MEFLRATFLKNKDLAILAVGFGAMTLAILATVIAVVVKVNNPPEPVIKVKEPTPLPERHSIPQVPKRPRKPKVPKPVRSLPGKDSTDETITSGEEVLPIVEHKKPKVQDIPLPQPKNANEAFRGFYDDETCENAFKALSAAWEELKKNPSPTLKEALDPLLANATSRCPESQKKMLQADFFETYASQTFDECKVNFVKKEDVTISKLNSAFNLVRVFQPEYAPEFQNGAHMLFTELDKKVQKYVEKLLSDPNSIPSEEILDLRILFTKNKKLIDGFPKNSGIAIPDMYAVNASLVDHVTKDIEELVSKLKDGNNQEKIERLLLAAQYLDPNNFYVKQYMPIANFDKISAYYQQVNAKLTEFIQCLNTNAELDLCKPRLKEIVQIYEGSDFVVDVSCLKLDQSRHNEDSVLKAAVKVPWVSAKIHEAFVNVAKKCFIGEDASITNQNKVATLLNNLKNAGLQATSEDPNVNDWNSVDDIRKFFAEDLFEELMEKAKDKDTSDEDVDNLYDTNQAIYKKLNASSLSKISKAYAVFNQKLVDKGPILRQKLLETLMTNKQKLDKTLEDFITDPSNKGLRIAFDKAFGAAKNDPELIRELPNASTSISDDALQSLIKARINKRRDAGVDFKTDPEMISLVRALYLADRGKLPASTATVSPMNIYEFAIAGIPEKAKEVTKLADLSSDVQKRIKDFTNAGSVRLFLDLPPVIGRSLNSPERLFDMLHLADDKYNELAAYLTDLSEFETATNNYNKSKIGTKAFNEAEAKINELFPKLEVSAVPADIPDSFRVTVNRPNPRTPSSSS